MSAEHLAGALADLHRELEGHGFTVLDAFDSPPARYGFARLEYRDPSGGEHTVRVGNTTSSTTGVTGSSLDRSPPTRFVSVPGLLEAHAALLAASPGAPPTSTVGARNDLYRELSALVERALPEGSRDECGALTRSYRDGVTAAGLPPYWGVRLAALVSLGEAIVEEVGVVRVHPALELLRLLASGVPLDWAVRRAAPATGAAR